MSATPRDSAIHSTAIAPHEEEARVYIRPNLNRDFSALMALLLVVITYHILHPTLLLESQFGRSFRGDSLQEAVSIGFLVAIALMVESWRNLWQERDTVLGKLRIAMVAVVLLYAGHNLLAIWNHSNLFFDSYDLDLLRNEDSELRRTFREETFLLAVKALNGMALFTGAALASVFYLWSPWTIGEPLRWIVRTVLGVAGLLLIVTSFRNQHPLFSTSENDTIVILLMGVAVALAVDLFWAKPQLWDAAYGRLKLAALAVVLLFALYSMAVTLGNNNLFENYYQVNADSYGELRGNTALHDGLRAFDLNAIFAGIALISILYLMSPWERLPIYLDTLRHNLLPLAVAIATIFFWERAVDLFKIETFLLPKPSVIWEEFKVEYPKLVASGWFTFQNALLGFIAGCSAGILTGIVSARFTQFSKAILPLAIAANSIPMIAFAPIANNWFGVTSINSKVAIVAVLCYFPSMISTVRGLTSVQPIQLELMRSYAATEFEIFRALRIPTALPLVFSALKLCTTLAMIGALVSEFFGGSLAGLGYRIREDAALFRFPISWAAILVASIFGVSFYVLVSAVERAMMPWYRSFRED